MEFKGDFNNVDIEVGFSPEWTLNINKNFEIVFGPKLTVVLFVSHYLNISDEPEREIFFGISSGARVDFDYIIKKNIKLYAALEAAATVRPDIHISSISNDGKNILLTVHPTILGRFAIGTKIKRYNVGLYTEYGLNKELVGGIEVGYSF
ncbi:hypothetical protein [Streptobacillus moniliformis]|uniref:hypothetical protein n=2 Tax=Streptobacillus moniliformis TaxID=34105 RepID=UPI0007E33054|nr:hypothetical protein [Streptobacillus moniliformis]